MPAPDPLIELVLRLQAGVECEVRGYADGFELRLWRDDDGFAPRHWLFRTGDVGAWLRTTAENELRDVGAHGCLPATLEPPAMSDVTDDDVDARLVWPAAAAALMQVDAGTARYELHLASDPPAGWARLGASGALAGIAADGRLVRIACSAPVVERRRIPVRLTADRHAVTLSAGRHLHVTPEPSGPQWYEPVPIGDEGRHEAARGNAALSTAADGSLHSLNVHDLSEGDPIEHAVDAAVVSEIEAWVSWPADVRAAAWGPDGDRRVGVRFGAEPSRWARLGENVWGGTTAAGELAALVLTGVDEVSGRPHRLEDRHRPPRCTIYGVAGELGMPSGSRSGFGGVATQMRLAFGDVERDRWIVVGSSRDPVHGTAREHLAHDLAPGEHRPDGPWEPVTIPVDGAPVAFELTRRGGRWGALARIGHTTVSVAAAGHDVGSVALATIDDLAPHLANVPANRWIGGPGREGGVVEDLMDALQNHAGAPAAGALFTDRVVDGWGGRDRYERLLGLHTMLRPLSGHGSSGEATRPLPGGGAEHRIHIRHAPLVEKGGGRRHTIVLQSESAGPRPPDPVPSRAAIGRGERHPITFRLVPDGERLLIDTDLLAILSERLGSIDEVARPLSEQR